MMNKIKIFFQENKIEFILILFLSISWTFLRYSFCDRQMVSTHSLVFHSAATPFQYRYLLPALLRFLYLYLHLNIVIGTFLFEFVFFFCLNVVSKKIYDLVFNHKYNLYIFYLGLFFTLSLTYVFTKFNNYYFIYDIPSLFFISLGTFFILKNNFKGLCFIMLIGTINRETTIILPAIYLLKNIKIQKGQNVKICVFNFLYLMLFWIGIKVVLFYTFINSSGSGAFQYYYGTSLKLTHFQDNFNFLFSTNLFYLLPFAGGSWIVYLFWNKLDSIILKQTLLLLIPFVIGMFFVGIIYELRVFGEFSVFLYLSLFSVLNNYFYKKNGDSNL